MDFGLKRSAFTLVELMVVIVLIGLLAGAVSLGVRGYLISGKQNIAKMEIANHEKGISPIIVRPFAFEDVREG